MSLIPTKRGNPCPICENESGKCREHRNGEIHLCMTYADARLGEIQSGYKCIKPDGGKGWSTWKLDNMKEWTQQERLEWKARNEQRRQLQASDNKQRRQRSLSQQERHEQYTRMLSELTLHPDDRADLTRRGFTHEQIELAGFKSIERYQKLQSQFSELLPGVSRDNRLIAANTGYLCPVRDIDGLIVGFQLRLRTLPTSESGRYRWLSADGQTLHLYPEGCQPEGELPLAVHFPQHPHQQATGLCEGVGSKPFLASQRLNIPFVGAAGGLFTSSPRLLEIYLEKLTRDREKEIVIPIDAGDILNNQVLARWHRVSALVQKLGYSVKFAWWEQVDKTRPDIDELENLDSIQYLTPAEFWETANAARKKFGFEARINLNLSENESSSEAKAKEQTANKGFSSDEPEWKVKARATWRKNRQFHADIKEATQWCNFSRPGANTIAFFRAGLGRGKTTRLREWVRQWKQLEDVSFLCLGYRNTLLLQLCDDEKGLGFYHLHEHSGMIMKSAPGEGIALCVDSLWRFSPEDFDGKIIILDEVKSVVKHLLHSSTVKNRDKIISLFAEAIRRARQVICLDGLMADWVVDYLHSLAPEKQIIRAENTYSGEKPRVNFLLGTAGIDNKIKVNDRSPWLKYLLEDSQIPAICSDSQAMIEGLDELLTARGLKVLRIDSKTVPEQYVKEFLANCNKYIEQHRPDVLLYTPSAESGVDVSIPNHFTHHFGFFFGVLDIDGILQMIGRIRDNITKFIWCKSFVADDEKQHSSSPFTETIAKSINQILIGDIATSLDGNWLERTTNHLKTVIANSLDENFRTSCIIKSVQNYEKSNLRECLKEVLVESGYKVVDCTLDSHEESGTKVKEATEQVKRQNSADIFKAEKIAPELVDELKFDATWQERCKVIQAKLRERLPGIDQTEIWTEDFIYLVKYGDRNFINNIENYWLFTHPDLAKRQSQDNLHWMARRLHTFIGNVKSRWARIHALLEMGFERFLELGKEWSNESPELIGLVELGKKYSNALGKHPGKSTPVQFLGNLLGLFGLRLRSRKDTEGKRWYHLNEEILNDSVRQQVLTCIEAKLTQPREEIDWDAAINEAHGISAENQALIQTEQGLKGTAPSPQILYTNQQEGAVNKLGLESQNVEEIEAHSNLSENQPQTQTEQGLKGTAPSPQILYTNQVEGAVNSLESQGIGEQIEERCGYPAKAGLTTSACHVTEGVNTERDGYEATELSPIDELIQAFEFCELPEEFALVTEGYTPGQIEDAIALQDSQPRRQQLTQWCESLTPLLTALDVAVEVVEKATCAPPQRFAIAPQPTESADQAWVILVLKRIAENDRFEELKKFVSERRFSVEILRKLSPRIQEVGGSFQPYKRLSLMLDALQQLTSIWVINPYLELV